MRQREHHSCLFLPSSFTFVGKAANRSTQKLIICHSPAGNKKTRKEKNLLPPRTSWENWVVNLQLNFTVPLLLIFFSLPITNKSYQCNAWFLMRKYRVSMPGIHCNVLSMECDARLPPPPPSPPPRTTAQQIICVHYNLDCPNIGLILLPEFSKSSSRQQAAAHDYST